MRRQLEEQREYSSLCEARILQLAPGHVIPVTRSSLSSGTPGRATSNPARDQSRLERQVQVSQKRLRDATAHVCRAGGKVSTGRGTRSRSSCLQVKQLKSQLESKERELAVAMQKSNAMHTRIGELESKVRHGGRHSNTDKKKRRDAAEATSAYRPLSVRHVRR